MKKDVPITENGLLELGYKKESEFGSINFFRKDRPVVYKMLVGKNIGKFFKCGEIEDVEINSLNEI